MNTENWIEVSKRGLSNSQERFVGLSWKILEYKCTYYRPDLIHPNNKKLYTVSDSVYDKLEGEYRRLSVELGEEPTAADMVDFDCSRPCCRLVAKKLGTPQ